MAFWTDIDVWDYIEQFDVPYCPIYDGGVRHTGCMFCAFGVVNEGSPNRFQLMQRSHPQIWRYCMDTLGMREVLDISRGALRDVRGRCAAAMPPL
jgi:3'-phosphoadenosine 5'-phosphosulfate sulfotransferase (PAPS reductase)/FAD synthetase